MSKETKVKIQNGANRENMVIALANAGYKVWVEKEEQPSWRGGDIYYVVFENEPQLVL